MNLGGFVCMCKGEASEFPVFVQLKDFTLQTFVFLTNKEILHF